MKRGVVELNQEQTINLRNLLAGLPQFENILSKLNAALRDHKRELNYIQLSEAEVETIIDFIGPKYLHLHRILSNFYRSL